MHVEKIAIEDARAIVAEWKRGLLSIMSRAKHAAKIRKIKGVLIQTALASDLREALLEMLALVESVDEDMSDIKDKFPEIG